MPNKGEKFEFYEALRRGDPQLRVLEESEAAEGGPMIPGPVLGEIFGMRAEYSLIDKLGIKRHPTSSLVTVVASETTGHAIPPVVAEEAAYIANEPAFVGTSVTVAKYGSLVSATEELLEDQSLFQSWFPGALARRLALQENVILYATLAAAGTLGLHLAAAHTLTEAQLWTFYEAMPDPWHDGAKIVMHRVTARTMRQFLIATPNMWQMAPELNIAVSGGSHWLDMPLFTNSNWVSIASAGDAVEIMTMVNPDAVIFVERKGLEIKTDSFTLADTGLTRFYSQSRFGIAAPIPLGVVHLTDHA
jgi:HK97 family phage major capsid protein